MNRFAFAAYRRGALMALLSLLLIVPALALDFPTLTGRVVDDASILNAETRAALTNKLAALEAKTTDQLVVVTLKSLQGTSIEDYGYQLGRRWQIGQKDKNNGVLLIVVPSERKVRIDVGYGLEGTLTDAVSRLIIENSIVPRFRANDYSGGITRAVDDIISVLTGDAAEWKQRAAKRPDVSPSGDSGLLWAVILLFWVGTFIYIIVGSWLDSRRKKRRWSDDFVWSRGSGAEYLPGSSSDSGGSSSGGGISDSGGGFSGGGGSFGGGGASGSW
jgi:uncharacterized protein